MSPAPVHDTVNSKLQQIWHTAEITGDVVSILKAGRSNNTIPNESNGPLGVVTDAIMKGGSSWIDEVSGPELVNVIGHVLDNRDKKDRKQT